MVSVEQNLQVQLNNVLVSMEAKRTDFDYIRQHVNKVKKYASDLQTFILSMCTMAVDDLAFFATSRMGRNSWQWR
jgi:hypothetical protein